MKRFLLIFLFIFSILTACVDTDVGDKGSKEIENKDEDEIEAANEVVDLKLQLQKADEEAGVTIENNLIYSSLAEAIGADPKIGVKNDFSLYPYDIAYFEDGSTSIVFLAINRLDKGMKNVSFDLTFGHQNGEYIFENVEVYLSEDQVGVIESNSSVPFVLDITPEDEEIFEVLTKDNVYLKMTNFYFELVE